MYIEFLILFIYCVLLVPSVLVATRIIKQPIRNKFSMTFLSWKDIPAWWQAMPNLINSTKYTVQVSLKHILKTTNFIMYKYVLKY